MITYEYACKVCPHTFEAEQKMTDEPLSECPKCHVAALYRIVSGGAGFVLRGDGWYRDGYSSKKETK